MRCGAGAGINIEGCGAVRAPALNDCAVRCGPLHCRAVRLRAKLLGPRRALVPIPRESRRKWPKEDLIYRPKLREPDIKYCGSVFHTKIASPRLETAVPPPVSVDVEVPSCREIKRDFDPGKRAGKDMDITNIIMANLNDHNNLGYGDRPVTEAALELMTKPTETLVTCTLPAVIDNPKPRKKVWCETDKKYIPVGREEMTGEPETEVFVVEASTESLPAIGRQTVQGGSPDVSREGPYDVYDLPPESRQSPLILNSLPGCQYHTPVSTDSIRGAGMYPSSPRPSGRGSDQ